MTRRIAVITGTRAEYGLLTSTLQAIDADPRLELQLVVTGMHLLRRFGHTVDEIVRDGWRIAARVPMQRGDDGPLDQAEGLSRGVAGIARFLERAASDIVVVLGDRIEALAGGLAAVTTGRVLAHIHGGDVAPGDFDDALRHTLTKLAHVHLPATRAAARRIVGMGEDRARVHVVGAPGLDRLRVLLRCWGRRPCTKRCSTNPVCESSDPRPFALVVQHAYGRPARVEQQVTGRVLNAVRAAGLRRVIVYPNSDRGNSGVIAALEQHAARSRDGAVAVARSLPRDDYLRALIAARVLIGNSSSGIIEAPLAGTPSINVGDRQAGREPGGRSVIHVGERKGEIERGLARALRMRVRPGRTVYGDGQAGARIAAVLAEVPLSPAFKRKLLQV
ncbi:MAG: UDP-N-acetylglucosamine 2-epimerase [Planctomycetota bacterium]